jgi:hypothetical protein
MSCEISPSAFPLAIVQTAKTELCEVCIYVYTLTNLCNTSHYFLMMEAVAVYEVLDFILMLSD